MKKVLVLLFFLIPVFSGARELLSPDGRISVNIESGSSIKYSISVDGNLCLSPSKVAMILEDGTVLGDGEKAQKVKVISIDETIIPRIYFKNRIQNKCNELTLSYKGYDIIFRAYNDGVAYRFVSTRKKGFNVLNETAQFSFPKDFKAFVPYVRKPNLTKPSDQFHNSFENRYEHINISQWKPERYAFLPLMVECDNNVKLVITESDLLHYPGMYLQNPDKSLTLSGLFAPYPKNRIPEDKARKISMFVDGTEKYIARSEGEAEFPWRVIGISRNDAELLANDLVFTLASRESREYDFKWVKPGKVAWDWWNDWNIRGVDFKSGVNTETYKKYIDFAAYRGIEYIIMDEGWSDVTLSNLYTVIPELDMDELLEYAAQKKVGIILWAGFYPLQKDIEGIFKYWAAKGVKGFKVDFFDSDDQQIPELLERMARAAAENQLVLDFHGVFKPTGLCRKYPNVLNYEGIYGQETTKWAASEKQVEYEVSAPFIRYFAGPADYTPGAMINMSRKNIRSSNSEPGAVGTRCRQLAEYIVYFAPLNMLCDSPSNYKDEPECTAFIASVPTVWDDVKPLLGKTGECVALARRIGTDWFVGAMNSWDELDITINLTFLDYGAKYSYELFRDGVNADKCASDYKRETGTVTGGNDMLFHLAPAGGCAIRFVKK